MLRIVMHLIQYTVSGAVARQCRDVTFVEISADMGNDQRSRLPDFSNEHL